MSDIEKNIPLVSIIIPCYNAEKYLAETLESVSGQLYKNWECIIMDDGSVDNSKQIALSYQRKDGRYKYFYQSNKGTSEARNKAIAESKGIYILPLDADDKISPLYIEQAVAVLQKNSDIKLVYCKARLFGKHEQDWDLRPYSYREMLIENIIFCTALFRRIDFDKTPGFSKDMKAGYEDWEFWLTFLNESDKVYQIPEIYFHYRIQDKSRNPSSNVPLQKELRQKVYEKHKDLYDKYLPISDVLYDYCKLRLDYDFLQHVYADTLKSTTFKIGRIILKPFFFVKNIFR